MVSQITTVLADDICGAGLGRTVLFAHSLVFQMPYDIQLLAPESMLSQYDSLQGPKGIT